MLTVIKREKDEDYHLVIVDADSQATMIVESPNPSCARGSQFVQQISVVRAEIETQFGGIITRRQKPNIRVTVTCVAFFDPPHGQEGKSPNGIELHPLLDIQFQ